MQLPNENATIEELRRFALGLSSAHRMRLAAALFYPEVAEISYNETANAETAARIFVREFENCALEGALETCASTIFKAATQ